MRIKGIDYTRVSGGDAADASWEVSRIQSMGLNPVMRQTEEDSFAIYLTPEEAVIYEIESRKEEEIYWHGPEGIAEQKRIGQETVEYLRSPEGRYQRHLEKRERPNGKK